jgi:hypothetical protein
MRRIIFTLVALITVFAVLNIEGTKAESKMQSYDAEIRESNIRFPRTMKPGKSYNVSVKVRNNGDVRWSGREFSLRSRIYRGPSGSPTQRDELTPEIDLTSVVETNEYYTFDYKVVAPNYQGQYILEFHMVRGSRHFGDTTRVTTRVAE